jgi:ABC-2 type transport system ATP-binding protein
MRKGIEIVELAIDRLGKRYKSGVWGLREFSIATGATLGPGALGLVGPTGAGKTTLVRLLATVMPPTQGTIAWDGEDVRRRPNVLRRMLGYLPQYFGVYEGLPGREFLLYLAALKGLGGKAARSRVGEVLEQVGLSEVAGGKMGAYSNGMRRRIGLAQALLNDPRLLLVDEPGATLDPQERVGFCELLAALADRRLMVVATDTIGDVASVARTVILLRDGRLLLQATPDELLRSARDRVWSLTVDQGEFVELRRQHAISHLERQGGEVRLRVIAAERPYPDALRVAPTLEDAYVYHMSLRPP